MWIIRTYRRKAAARRARDKANILTTKQGREQFEAGWNSAANVSSGAYLDSARNAFARGWNARIEWNLEELGVTNHYGRTVYK